MSERYDFGERICKVLGLEPSLVTGLTLTVLLDSPVIVDAYMIVNGEEYDGLVTEIKRYKLVERGSDE